MSLSWYVARLDWGKIAVHVGDVLVMFYPNVTCVEFCESGVGSAGREHSI